MAAMRFRLSLQQRVWSQTGSRAAVAALLSTMRRNATAMAAMHLARRLEQFVRSLTGSHVATAAARLTSEVLRDGNGRDALRAKFGAARAEPDGLACLQRRRF